jgi:hypothetical protein
MCYQLGVGMTRIFPSSVWCKKLLYKGVNVIRYIYYLPTMTADINDHWAVCYHWSLVADIIDENHIYHHVWHERRVDYNFSVLLSYVPCFPYHFSLRCINNSHECIHNNISGFLSHFCSVEFIFYWMTMWLISCPWSGVTGENNNVDYPEDKAQKKLL